MKRLAAALVLAFAATGASAQAKDCTQDLDACLVAAIAENAAFMDECGKIFPNIRKRIDDTLMHWSVLRLGIPGAEDLGARDHPLRVAMGEQVGLYLRRIAEKDRDVECTKRYNMMRVKKPTLRASSVALPENALEKYLR